MSLAGAEVRDPDELGRLFRSQTVHGLNNRKTRCVRRSRGVRRGLRGASRTPLPLPPRPDLSGALVYSLDLPQDPHLDVVVARRSKNGCLHPDRRSSAARGSDRPVTSRTAEGDRRWRCSCGHGVSRWRPKTAAGRTVVWLAAARCPSYLRLADCLASAGHSGRRDGPAGRGGRVEGAAVGRDVRRRPASGGPGLIGSLLELLAGVIVSDLELATALHPYSPVTVLKPSRFLGASSFRRAVPQGERPTEP